MAGYLPGKDEDLQFWSINYRDLLAMAPVSYGCTAADVTALGTLVDAYGTALETAKAPSTRTPVAIMAKDVARSQLVTEVRALTRKIQATPTVTPTQKLALGITVPDHDPSPVPAPDTKPVLSLTGRAERSVDVRMVDEASPSRRGKPAGVDGADVYSFVGALGAEPPADMSLWRHEGHAKRATMTINYEQTDVGKVAHIRARWYSPKGEQGPVSEPVSTLIAA